ncbi:hypothetical protein HDU98_002439 [Podochytrium sp. JEL0797]|nr:hypothetical protein HDU98_002439 [Podochytrium sp. JEL0797]
MLDCASNIAANDWLLTEPAGIHLPLPESIDTDLMIWNNSTPASFIEFNSIDSLFLDNSILPFVPDSQLLPCARAMQVSPTFSFDQDICPFGPASTFSPMPFTEQAYFPSNPVAVEKRSRQILASRKWRAAKSAQVMRLDNRIQHLQEDKLMEKHAAVLESVAATFGPREAELEQRIAMLEGQLDEIRSSIMES